VKLEMEVFGWSGAALTLGGYFLMSLRWLSGRSSAYHAINLVGASAVIVGASFEANFPLIAASGVWMGIALLGLWRNGADVAAGLD